MRSLASATVAALATALVGCSPVVRTCAKGTVFVDVTLVGGAIDAGQLAVDISLDGGPARRTTLDHAVGKERGGIEIDFPSGYPTGKTITVAVTALSGAIATGHAEATVTANGACAGLSLTVGTTAPDSGGPDASMGDLALDLPAFDGPIVIGDLAGTDTLPIADDLALTDALPSTDDLFPVDLLTVDGVILPVENCFDGIDNDSDGMIDCADPDCTGGGTPVAECIPDPGVGFVLGTRVAGACPSEYPTKGSLFSNLANPTCDPGSCTCSGAAEPGYCYAMLTGYPTSDTLCAGTANYTSYFYSTQCSNNAATPGMNDPHKVDVQWNGFGCQSAGGTPSKNAATYTTESLCSRPQYGAGCTGGKICVPKAANHCATKSGATVLSCPSGYTKPSGQFYDQITDDGVCNCQCLSHGGTCDPDPLYAYSDANACTNNLGRNTVSSPCNTSNLTSWTSFTVKPPTSGGACTEPVAYLDKVPTTSKTTLCCTP